MGQNATLCLRCGDRLELYRIEQVTVVICPTCLECETLQAADVMGAPIHPLTKSLFERQSDSAFGLGPSCRGRESGKEALRRSR